MKVAPTLVKYAAANPYQQATQRELEQAARELMADAAIDAAPVVDLVERGSSLEVELAATLIYGACHYPFRQVREQSGFFERFPCRGADRVRRAASRPA